MACSFKYIESKYRATNPILADKLNEQHLNVLRDAIKSNLFRKKDNKLYFSKEGTKKLERQLEYIHSNSKDNIQLSRTNNNTLSISVLPAEQLFSVENEGSKEVANPQKLYEDLIQFLSAKGISAESMENYRKRTEAKDIPVDAVGIADMLNRVVGFTDISSLTEETAHMMVEMFIPTDNSIYDQVVDTETYRQVKQDYADIYAKEIDFRKEALGKIVKQAIIDNNNQGIGSRLLNRIKYFWNRFIDWVKNTKGLDTYVQDIIYKANKGKYEWFDTNRLGQSAYFKLDEEQFKNSGALNNFKESLEKALRAKIARYNIHEAKAQKSFGKKEGTVIAQLQRDLENDNITLGIVKFLNVTEDEIKLINRRLQNYVNNIDVRTPQEAATLLNRLYRFLEAYKPILLDIRADIDLFGQTENYKVLGDSITDLLRNIENIENQYKKMGSMVVAEVLYPFAKANPQIKSLEDLVNKIEQAPDINLYRKMFNSLSDSGDDILATLDQLVKQHKEEARLTTEYQIKELLRLDKELKDNGIKDTHWMYEKSKGKLTGNLVDKYNNFEYQTNFETESQRLINKYDLPTNRLMRNIFMSTFNEFKVREWIDNSDYAKGLLSDIKSKNRGASDTIIYELTWEEMIKEYKKEWAIWHEVNTDVKDDVEERIKDKINEFYDKLVFDNDRRNITDQIYDRYVRNNAKTIIKNLTAEEQQAINLFIEWLDDVRRFSNYKNDYYYIGELSRPSDIYLNSEYDQIMSNVHKQKYYNWIIENKKNQDSKIPNKFTSPYLAPQIRKDLVERFKSSDDKKKVIDDTIKDNLKIRETDTEFGQLTVDDDGNVVQFMLADEKGNPVNFLPVYFTNKIDDTNDLSLDLTSTMSSYIAMSNDYDEMNKIIDILELSKELLSKRKIEVGNNILSKTKEIFTGEKVISRQEGGNAADRYTEYLNMVAYGQMKAKESNKVFEYLGLDQAKVIDAFNSYTSISGLALNVYAGLANPLLGNILIKQEQHASQYFNRQDMRKADKIYWSELSTVLNDIGSELSTSKLRLFGEAIDVLQDYKNRLGEMNTDRTKFGKMFTTSSLFFLNHMGEHQMQFRTALAMANNMKLKLNGKEVTLYEALEVKNHSLVIPTGLTKQDGTEFTQKDLIAFGLKVQALNQSLHGIYNDIDRSVIQKYALGRSALLFRKFIVPGGNRRFEGKRFNYSLGTEVEGYYRTSFKFLTHLFSELKEGQLNLASNWDNLSDMEKQNIIRTISEVSYMFMAITLATVLSSLAGDDDDWTLNMAAVQANRLYSELRFYTSPSEALRILRSPAAGIRQLQLLMNYSKVLDPYGYIFEDEPLMRTYKAGRNKGETYFYVNTKRAFPIVGQIESMLFPEERLKFYVN